MNPSTGLEHLCEAGRESVPVDANRAIAYDLRHEAAAAHLYQDVIRQFEDEKQDLPCEIEYCLRRVCQTQGWSVGHAIVLQEDDQTTGPGQHLWHLTRPAQEDPFRSAVEQAFNESSGQLLRLLEGAQSPYVVPELSCGGLFGRVQAAQQAGLRSGVLAPVRIDHRPHAFISFYSARQIQDRAAVRELLGSVASLIAQRVQFKQLQRAVTDSAWLLQRRVGRELHDNVCQDLVGLAYLSREMLAASYQNNALALPKAVELAQGVSNALARTRAISKGLSPVECRADELPRALGDLVDSSGRRFNIHFSLDCMDQLTLPSDKHARHLFFIAHEAVINAVKHSGSTFVHIGLVQENDQIELTVVDNGDGRVQDPDLFGGIGVRIMRYRAETIGARLTISSDPNGTLMTCKLKLKKANP